MNYAILILWTLGWLALAAHSFGAPDAMQTVVILWAYPSACAVGWACQFIDEERKEALRQQADAKGPRL